MDHHPGVTVSWMVDPVRGHPPAARPGPPPGSAPGARARHHTVRPNPAAHNRGSGHPVPRGRRARRTHRPRGTGHRPGPGTTRTTGTTGAQAHNTQDRRGKHDETRRRRRERRTATGADPPSTGIRTPAPTDQQASNQQRYLSAPRSEPRHGTGFAGAGGRPARPPGRPGPGRRAGPRGSAPRPSASGRAGYRVSRDVSRAAPTLRPTRCGRKRSPPGRHGCAPDGRPRSARSAAVTWAVTPTGVSGGTDLPRPTGTRAPSRRRTRSGRCAPVVSPTPADGSPGGRSREEAASRVRSPDNPHADRAPEPLGPGPARQGAARG